MTLTIYNAEDIPQGSDAWLEARRGIVTASTVGKLLTSTGKVANNETSRGLTETLALERITGRVEYIHPSRDMERGTILEPFARDLYAEHHAPVEEIGFMRCDDIEGGIVAGYSPDGLVGDDGLIEIKSRTPRIQMRTIRTGRVPAENLAQLHMGMFIADRPWIDYVSYSPGLPLFVTRVRHDPLWHNAILDALAQAEDRIGDLIHDYNAEVAAHNMPPTDYFDPFAEEDIIIG